MKNTTLFRHTLLVLSVSLLTCFSPLVAEEKNNELDYNIPEVQISEPTKGSKKQNEGNAYKDNYNDVTQPLELKTNPELEKNNNEEATTANNQKKNFWDNPDFLIAGGSAILSLISVLISAISLWRVRIKNSSVIVLKEKLERDINLAGKELQSQITLLKNQLNQEKMQNKSQFNEIRSIATTTTTIPITLNTPEPIRQNESSFASIEPLAPPQPLGPSKSALIAALNKGDRQQLREAALSELNITSESENAIITGRSTNTDLEVVPGGGSYLLLMLQGQPWLFPTEKTLKGFTAVQTSKGIFGCEQQTIASPQLLEPALLEGSGNRWKVIQIGRIAVP